MRADTTRYDRPPPAVGLALWFLWFALVISAAGYLFALIRDAMEYTSRASLPFLYLQIVAILVICGFVVTINVSLARRRNWARGSLFGVVLLETVIVGFAWMIAGSHMGLLDILSQPIFAFNFLAYALRVAGLALVMIPGRHWYRTQ